MSPPVVVYKLGGSLLSLPDVGDRLERVVADRGQSRSIVVVGGGPAADAVREWDRVHGLGDRRSHDLAVESLRLTESLALTLLPRGMRCPSRSHVEIAWDRNRLPLIAVAEFLPAEEQRLGLELHRSWDVTTDSIAAWLAVHWPAKKLVLLKSCDREPGDDWKETASRGCVDAYFPNLATSIPHIDWINLRSMDLGPVRASE